MLEVLVFATLIGGLIALSRASQTAEAQLADQVRAAAADLLQAPEEYENRDVMVGHCQGLDLLVGRNPLTGRPQLHLSGDRLPHAVEFEREQYYHRSQPDLKLGDADFDSLVYLQGDPTELISRFNQAARTQVTRFVDRFGGALQNGRLIVDADLDEPAASLREAVEALLATAHAIELDPDAFAARLAETAREDPNPDLRAHALSALLTHYPAARERQTAIDAGLADRDPAVRLVAALVAPRAVAEPCLRWLARFPAGSNARLGPVVARAIRAVDDVALEGAALALLRTGGGACARREAIAALQQIGTRAAVGPLLAVAAEGAEWERLARNAVGAILARGGSVDAGRLSVVPPEPGDAGVSSPAR